MINFKKTFILLGMAACCTAANAATTVKNAVPPPPVVNATPTPAVTCSVPDNQHPFYIGAIAGYGNTNWQEMISLDGVSATSTPIDAGGSGLTLGAMAGYQITRYFAVEGNYMHFPESHITFAPNNVYGITSFDSETNEYAVLAKFMVPVGHTKLKIFSEIGPSYVQRNDDMANKGHFGGGFGVGADYDFNARWFTELNLNYFTGFGESELKPAYDYVPFLYTLNLRVGYRFSLF